MTNDEFSNEFDTLLSSYSDSTSTLEFDEYEKSVFLTKAQEEIVIDLYNGKNPSGDSFEKTEEIRRYLSNLVKTKLYAIKDKQEGYIGLSKDSVFFELPPDLWFITYESVDLDGVKCKTIDTIVVPVTQDEFYNIQKNPFRGPGNKRVLRIDAGKDIIELVSKYDIKNYTIRYLSRPNPIVLVDLPSHLSINNINRKTECELSTAVHRALLERAVGQAIMSRSKNSVKT